MDSFIVTMNEKPKRSSNTEEEHKKALVNDDPTQVSQEDLENFAREAMKKFKSMN